MGSSTIRSCVSHIRVACAALCFSGFKCRRPRCVDAECALVPDPNRGDRPLKTLNADRGHGSVLYHQKAKLLAAFQMAEAGISDPCSLQVEHLELLEIFDLPQIVVGERSVSQCEHAQDIADHMTAAIGSRSI